MSLTFQRGLRLAYGSWKIICMRRRIDAGRAPPALRDDAVEDDAAARRRVEADEQPRHRALAAARLADERERAAAPDREGDVVDGVDELARLAFGDPVQPGQETSKVLASPMLRPAPRSIAIPARRSRGRPQRRRVQPAGGARRARRHQVGTAVKHGANACGQRGLNGQPAGIAFRRGIAPSIWSSRSRSSSIAGIDPIRPTV
jgi:hypothetical protein